MDESIAELREFIFDTQRTFNKERLDTIKEKNKDIQVVHLEPEERHVFREASVPVRKMFKEMAGPRGAALLDSIVERVERLEAEADASGQGSEA